MIAITVAAFIVSIRQGSKVKGLRFISYYIIAALVTDFLSIYIYFFQRTKQNSNGLQANPESIFSLFEIVLLYIFLYCNINGLTKRKIMLGVLTFFFIFLIYCCIHWHRSPLNLPTQFFGFEALCLVIPTIFYFHELFTSNQFFSFKSEPPFWVALGILICNTCSLPISILAGLIDSNLSSAFDVLAMTNYLLYSVFFLLLMKAYLCVQQAK